MKIFNTTAQVYLLLGVLVITIGPSFTLLYDETEAGVYIT